MADIKKLKEERVTLVKNSRELLERAEKEKRDLTADEQGQWDKMNADIDNKGREIDRWERQQKLEAETSRVDDHGLGNFPGSAVGNPGKTDPERLDQFEATNHLVTGWVRNHHGRKISNRAKQAANQMKQSLTGREIKCRLRTDNMQIRNEYNAYKNAGMLVGTTTAGGYLVPQGFVPRLELAMLEYGPMLRVAEVMRTASGNSMPWPTADDTANTGAQLDEQASIGNSVDPAIGVVTFGAFKYSSKLVKVSNELTEDSAIDIPSLLGELLGTRLGRILNTKCTTGTGSGTTINGIVTASTAGKTAAATNAITADEIIDLFHSVGLAYRGRATFMAHDAIWSVIRKLKDGNDQYLWQPGMQAGVADRLFGRPVEANNDMASSMTANAKTLLFGDLSKYKVRLVAQVRVRRLVERYADTDEEGYVAFLRADANLLDAGQHPVKHLKQAAS